MGELLDRLKGNVNEAVGKAKRKSSDPEVRAKGAVQEIKGKAQQVKASLKAELTNDIK
ncbi:CsbD family protein [uncultured Parasphingorhabdus sp.]|uniref:CsbD family protein n=1 Tax=uncultured Parasphingorhabdus sp. TaxID=2709694 RepID=UPI0030D81514|tara:strand:- start:288 stop:461 length:174 start_codon:yes stop_codon:yes gene_type:complete